MRMYTAVPCRSDFKYRATSDEARQVRLTTLERSPSACSYSAVNVHAYIDYRYRK